MNFRIALAILFCVSVFYLSTNMGNEPLTRKILEEILDVKLSPLKASIKDLNDKMAEFQKFIDEANKNYEDTNTRMTSMEKVFSTITTDSKALSNTILQLEGKISKFKENLQRARTVFEAGVSRNPWHSSTSERKEY